MAWQKQGLIYRPQSIHPKLATHVANPLPIFLDGDTYRVFYSGRDALNRSSVGYVDIDIVKREVIYVHPEPVFLHGDEASFYSHGVSIGNCYDVGETRYILFMGWQCPPDRHWRGEIGRLVLASDLSTLTLDSHKPFMAVDEIDPISLSYPWVMHDESNGYHMWYGSTLQWDAGNAEMLHVIHHASSVDGHVWQRNGLAIPYEIGVAQAFSHPAVSDNSDDGYQMWFSYRSGKGEKYRIGYAQSSDKVNWELKLKDVGIDVSEQGWDSDMIEYPAVFQHKDQRYLLYNGNGHGHSGFGLAVWE
jgi:hypothetical protein